MPTNVDSDKTVFRGSARWLPFIVTMSGVATAIVMLLVSWRRPEPLTELELVLFQILILGLGLGGSYAFGRAVGNSPPNARSAFRRVMRLYEALGRFTVTVNERRSYLVARADETDMVALSAVLDSLDMIGIQVAENLATVDDAMEDWRDLAPAEVKRIEDKARMQQEARQGGIGIDE